MDTTTDRLRTTTGFRTFRAFQKVATGLILGFALLAPLVSGVGTAEPSRAPRPSARPRWTRRDARRNTGCVSIQEWKRQHPQGGLESIPEAFVVVRLNGDRERMPAQETFDRVAEGDAASGPWVIGACAAR